jgi:hypothetical protein
MIRTLPDGRPNTPHGEGAATALLIDDQGCSVTTTHIAAEHWGVVTRNPVGVHTPTYPHPRGDDMRKNALLLLSCVVLAGALIASGPASMATGKGSKILKFDTMVGVPRPYTELSNAIRGVQGGGLPWVIDSAHGQLQADGDIEIEVEGLVIDPNDPAAITAGVAGINPVPNFRAIVSCLSKDAAGNAVTSNVQTGTFPASMAGDSQIEDTVSLPDPCIAPIVFVTSPSGAWFAATGM